jgi:hypothetical protein
MIEVGTLHRDDEGADPKDIFFWVSPFIYFLGYINMLDAENWRLLAV